MLHLLVLVFYRWARRASKSEQYNSTGHECADGCRLYFFSEVLLNQPQMSKSYRQTFLPSPNISKRSWKKIIYEFLNRLVVFWTKISLAFVYLFNIVARVFCLLCRSVGLREDDNFQALWTTTNIAEWWSILNELLHLISIYFASNTTPLVRMLAQLLP